MGEVAAVLIDLYETAVHCDFMAHAAEIPAVAGVAADAWRQALMPLFPAVTDGTLSMGDAYAQVIASTGGIARPDLVEELLVLDQDLLIASTHVHEDTVPLLDGLRRRGIATALVSNCAANTRPLLDHLGLTALIDVLVLSCEVGCAKPSPAIYRAALAELGVSAEAALFVDDQAPYCSGAAALGIRSFHIRRNGTAGPGADGAEVIRTLRDLEAHC